MAVDALSPPARSKVVVLDFFATWYLPCVASIPHVNALIGETKDLPVVFLAVASEARGVLAPVLDKHPMRATLVLDRDGETYKNYWVSRLPFVDIIGTDGRIAAFQHPERIARADIEKAMRLRATSEIRPGRPSVR